MLHSMSRIRRRAASVLLLWIGLGLLASAGAGHTVSLGPGNGTSHCGEPARNEAPAEPRSSCQWPLPLLCCQQVAAADATSPGLVMLGALWLRSAAPILAPLPSAPRGIPAALAMPASRSLERSVVLQV